MSEFPESSIPLGRPIQSIRPNKPSTESQAFAARGQPSELEQSLPTDSESSRSGDNTFGRPIQKVRENIPVNLSMADLEQEEKLTPADETEVFVNPPELPRWLSSVSSGLWLIALFFAGLLGWFLFAQILDTIQKLLQLPWWLQIFGWGLMVFFTFIVVYPLARLYRAYQRLRPLQQQIRMTVLRTTTASLKKLQQARQAIVAYLQDYEVDELADELKKLGISEQNLDKLRTSKKHLLEESPKTTSDWLTEFERDFLKLLDMTAQARIKKYAGQVALKTALSPNALIDTAVVLYNGFSLLRDLCVLYQVRAGQLGMWYLLGLVIFQGYVAGQMENLTESLMENFTESATGILGAKLVSAKIGEATINYLFLQRIGKSMVERLRPFA